MYDGDCYPNGSYFWDSHSRVGSNSLMCVLPGTTLTTGQWVRVENNDPVDCNSNGNSDPFNCTTVTSPNATLSLYLPGGQGLPVAEEGLYKCCLPTSCSTAGTNIFTANIFSKCVMCTDLL